MNIFRMITFFILLSFSTSTCSIPKIVGLIPVRNESIYINQCLKALSLYTDSIVLLDDCSDDNTVEIVQKYAAQYRVEKIIQKTKWNYSDSDNRSLLLKAGREIGGTHFVIVDADEMFTSNCLDNNFLRNKILELNPGDILFMAWIQLWGSTDFYRFDKSIWTHNYKPIVFCDNGTAFYDPYYIHIPRVPLGLNGKSQQINGYEHGLMHFQFVNRTNVLIKGAWYKCLEHIKAPEKTIEFLNNLYALDETEVGLVKAPSAWFDRYPFFDKTIFDLPETWRKKQIQKWVMEYGKDYFTGLHVDEYIEEKQKFTLITSLYNETNEARRSEYVACLEKNLTHPLIGTIHIFYDTSKDDSENKLRYYLESKNVQITLIDDKPTYGMCFTLANNLYPNSKIILSNGDIFFNKTLNLLDHYDLTNKFLALTRWDVTPNGNLEIFKQYDDRGIFQQLWSETSQDTWIFQTPLKPFNHNNIKIGTMQCDALIAYRAHMGGLKVINPCLSVQCCHLHLSQVRHYHPDNRPGGPWIPVPWQMLEEKK